MATVTTEKRREYVTRYRAKLGVRDAEKAYAAKYGRELYATAKGRAYQLFKTSRHRARQKAWDFDLTVDFILERINGGACPVLGLPFDLSKERDTWFNPLAPSLDRDDPARGYTKDNVQVVSAWWNIAKGQWAEPFNRMAVRRAAEYFETRRFPWET